MKTMSENQGNPRKMSEYFSPKCKVTDYLGCPVQQCSPSKLAYFQETPMKPSQAQNRLSSVPKMKIPLPSHTTLTPPSRTRDSISSVSKPAEHCQRHFRGQRQTAQTASSAKLHPARSNCSLLKRGKDSEGIDDGRKKQCLQSPSASKHSASQPQRLSAPPSGPRRPEPRPEQTKARHAREASGCPSARLATPTPRSPQLSPEAAPGSPQRPGIWSRLPGVGKAFMVKVTEDYVHLQSPGKSVKHCFTRLAKAKRRERVHSSGRQLPLGNRDTTAQDSMDRSSRGNCSLASHRTAHPRRSSPAAQVKLPCTDGRSGENAAEEIGGASKTQKRPARSNATGHLSGPPGKRKSSARRSSVIPDDIGDLFTPDPRTYVSGSKQKTVVRLAAEQGKLDPPTTEGDGVSDPPAPATSRTPSAESSCRRNKQSTGADVSHPPASVTVKDDGSPPKPKLPSLVVRVERLNIGKDFKSISVSGLTDPVPLWNKQLRKRDRTPPETATEGPEGPESPASAVACGGGSTYGDPPTPTLPSGKAADEDDMELGLDLSMGLDLDESQSPERSEEELPTLQQMMEFVAKPPDTPEKEAVAEPVAPAAAPISPRRRSASHHTTALSCKNNLDQMLRDIRSNMRSKEKRDKETVLLSSCRGDDLRNAEEDEENHDAAVTSEQQEFLQRFPVVSNTIRDVHPGEVVFDLESCGRLFSQHTLQLRHCKANPQGTAQKTLLWSSSAQLSLHVRMGLFQDAYDFSPCPPQVTCFLFKMMSVHTERMISDKILQALCVIARSAANHIVKSGSQEFEVWVPSVADVTLVLLNMGASFVTLFPLEKFQPPFNEGDLLEDMHIGSDSPTSSPKPATFPKHNYSNVLKYLSYCMALCPRAFSDPELLLLLSLTSRLALEVHFTLEPHIDLRCLQRHVISNVRDWEDMLPTMCLALTELTADHHNMCCLVQLLPDHARGKQLRRHLSVCMISKLLDGNCTYKPSGQEFQLSYLLPYLSRMKPSSLLRSLLSSCSVKKVKDEDMAALDQQTYYLCYSLLTLVNQASNYAFFKPHQKEQLLQLCSELDRHIKRDMKENDKCLYRNKVNDLVARIYTKWWMLVQKIRPLNDKLYEFWKPSPQDIPSSSSNAEEMSEEEEEEEEEMVEKEVVEVEEEMEEEEMEEEVEEEMVEEEEVVMVEEEEEEMVEKEVVELDGSEPADHPEVSSEKEDEMDKEADEEQQSTWAVGYDEEPERMNEPAAGEARAECAMEQS